MLGSRHYPWKWLFDCHPLIWWATSTIIAILARFVNKLSGSILLGVKYKMQLFLIRRVLKVWMVLDVNEIFWTHCRISIYTWILILRNIFRMNCNRLCLKVRTESRKLDTFLRIMKCFKSASDNLSFGLLCPPIWMVNTTE